MPDERSRLKVIQALSEKLDPEVVTALMECVPPFAWTEIATKRDLAELEERLAVRLDGRLHQAETRIIMWTVGAVFGGIAAIGAATAGIAALVS